VTSVTHAWSGPDRSNWRAKMLQAMGNGCRDCVVTAPLFVGGVLWLSSVTADAGWLLLSPPPSPTRDDPWAMDDTAPLGRWAQGGAYDTARECERERSSMIKQSLSELRQNSHRVAHFKIGGAMRCISTDDPRLRTPPTQ
jgi:hypothetical protein